MAKLKELVYEHGFGVKVTDCEGYWFIPSYEFEDFYYGISKRKANDYFMRTSQGWHLYVEPKKTFKKYVYWDYGVKRIVFGDDSNAVEFLDGVANLMCDGKPVYIEVEE